MKQFEVYGPRFIIQAPEGDTRTAGGIHLLSRQEDVLPVECVVMSAGKDSPVIKAGDKVLVNAHAIVLKDRCISADERLYLINEADVYAIVREDGAAAVDTKKDEE